MDTSDYENSCATRKKWIILSPLLSNGFDVPVRVVRISELQFAEKNKVLLKLKTELDNVRAFQERLDLHRAHGVTMPFSKEVLSRRNAVERLKANARKSVGPKRRAECPRGGTRKFESAKELNGKESFSLALRKQCENLLQKLMLHRYGWMFSKPVDIVEFGIPDYYDVIKNPMDLGTIKEKLCSGNYSSPLYFLADVRLTFANAMTYNPPGNDVHVMANTLSKFFEQKWKPIDKKLAGNGSQQEKFHEEMDLTKSMRRSNKRKITNEEKHNLSKDLEVHLDDLPDNIIDFLREHASNGNEVSEDEIEVDIDDLNDDALYNLRKMLDDHVQEKQNHTETGPSVIEQSLNESGVSKSTMQLYEDEDVDICGNETPDLSHHKIEIEKETNNKSDIQSTSRDSISGLDHVEQISQQKPNSMESDSKKDDGDGVHRAAVLKNRFAETILKAQKKILYQGEKGAFEKFHCEKDAIENQRRKEKARFQAEAALEAKRPRNLEREAARQALLKMEKTVEIDEASRFFEDLEILRTVKPDQLPSSVDADDESQDGLGSFRFGASNPLEQLGLYLKRGENDDE